jgi:hypothetical protein
MAETNNSRKRALECTRLAADCMQLVSDVHNPALQSHFLRMARVWSDRAVRGPSKDAQTKNRANGGYPDRARIYRQ